MGKAYSEEEKSIIKEKLWIEGLKLFHNDEDELNIRDLTKKVGISLGSFYNFYQDKNSLINDIIIYRSRQKLSAIKESFPASINNEKQYVYKIIVSNFEDMSDKIRNKKIYSDAFYGIGNLQPISNNISRLFLDFFIDLEAYWNDNGRKIKLDVNGVWNLILGFIAMYAYKKNMDQRYFEEIMKLYLESGLDRYINEE